MLNLSPRIFLNSNCAFKLLFTILSIPVISTSLSINFLLINNFLILVFVTVVFCLMNNSSIMILRILGVIRLLSNLILFNSLSNVNSEYNNDSFGITFSFSKYVQLFIKRVIKFFALSFSLIISLYVHGVIFLFS